VKPWAILLLGLLLVPLFAQLDIPPLFVGLIADVE
jgi:hypothetical protein